MFKFVLILYDFYSYNFSSSNINSKFSKFLSNKRQLLQTYVQCSSKTFSIPLTSTQTNHHKECELSGPLSAINSQIDTVLTGRTQNHSKGPTQNLSDTLHSVFL